MSPEDGDLLVHLLVHPVVHREVHLLVHLAIHTVVHLVGHLVVQLVLRCVLGSPPGLRFLGCFAVNVLPPTRHDSAVCHLLDILDENRSDALKPASMTK